jgi:hypothetical protein
MIFPVLILACVVLHLSLIATLRNGVLMMKYVVFHSEEFQNPVKAFILGAAVCIVIVVIEAVSLLFQVGQSSPGTIITNFVQFKIMVESQDMWMKSRENFAIKKAVALKPIEIRTDMKKLFPKEEEDFKDIGNVSRS